MLRKGLLYARQDDEALYRDVLALLKSGAAKVQLIVASEPLAVSLRLIANDDGRVIGDRSPRRRRYHSTMLETPITCADVQ